ncbi:Solitary outer membrane autotransporter beta-barrel domain [Vibrio lentus]|nr:Solitary outer membrane autotransporter beta-barrel domain [Vibrio lentus]
MGLQNQLNRHWSIGYGLGAHTLYYRNKYEYKNSLHRTFQSQLDWLCVEHVSMGINR